MFASSPYQSARALLASSATAPPHTDLAQHPTITAATVRSRAFKNELILFSFDFCGIGEALALILSLRRVGFEHFAPLSAGPETCATTDV